MPQRTSVMDSEGYLEFCFCLSEGGGGLSQEHVAVNAAIVKVII